MFIGAHESVAGGLERAVHHAVQDGCRSLQVFVRPNRRWRAAPLAGDEAEGFRAAMVKEGLAGRVFAHDIYLVNLSSVTESVREKSLEVIEDELDRCEQLGIRGLVFHGGSPKEMGEEWGLRTLASNLDLILGKRVQGGGLSGKEEREEGRVALCVENSAGQGSTLCSSLESIGTLIGLMEYGDHLGVCIDTCHAFAAGYPLHTAGGWVEFMDELEERVGLHRVKLFHLNDSKTPLGSRVDRHAQIGDGHLGLDAFRRIVNDPRLASMAGILETPPDKNEDTPYGRQVELLRSLKG